MFPNSKLLQLAQKSRAWLILTISLGFISGLMVLGQAAAISRIISSVFLEGLELNDLSNLLVMTLILFTMRAILTWLGSLSAKTIAVQVKSRVRKLLLEKLKELGPAYLQGEQTGELNRTIIEGVEALDAYFSHYLPQLVLSALVPTTILIFVFPMDLLSGFILLLTAPLIPYFMYLIGSSAQVITDRQYSTLSRLAAHFLDSLQGLTTLRLFNRASEQVEKIRQSSDQYRATTMKVLRVTFLSALTLEMLATLSTAVVAVEIGLRLLYFKVSLEQALFLLMIAPEFYIPLRMLGLRFHAGMEGQSAAERIFEILDTKPLHRKGSLVSQEGSITYPMQTIELDQVSFTYPGEKRPALSNLNLVIKQGEHIALVGESGSGKSTLAKLILGFFPPGKGEIRLNGIELSENHLENWRRGVAWVPQEPALFYDTIAANIRLARPDADDSAVASAASAAHLADFIESLPDGYDTLIGEGGARLSGGQAQRLALARAFLKDAPILLLDEPTSQLDPRTETLLAQATASLLKGRTVITIAHRLNTIYQADRILVLKEGEIVETGSHQDLMGLEGEYKNLVLAYTGLAADPDKGSQDGDPELDQYLNGSSSISLSIPEDTRSETRSQPGSSIFRRLLSFFRPYWAEVLLSAALGSLTIFSSLGLMGASAWLISMAALHPNIAVLQVAIVGVRFFGISRGVARYFERLVSHNLTFKILSNLRVWFYESLVPLAPARILKYRAGDLLSRIISDIKTLEDFYIRSLAPPLVASLIGLGTCIFLFPYHNIFALIAGGFFLLSGLGLPLAVRILAHKPGENLVKARSELTANLTSYIQGFPDLLVFGAADNKSRQIEQNDQLYKNSQLQLAQISGLNGAALILFSNLAMWLVLVAAIPLVSSGSIPGVMLATLALVVLSSFESVQPLPQAMETLSSSIKAGSRLFEILDIKPEVSDPETSQSFPTLLSVQAKELCFHYPENDQLVLDGLNFELKSNQILALVGPSGAGKSTLANLLLRFWGGYQGEIDLGDKRIPLIDMSQDQIRKHISVISQASYLFNDSIRANIALGNPGASLDEIIQAARLAQIHQKIINMPEGYESWIGERGVRLSAGERQRIHIARAILKDAPFFLLDEPTANLDPITEREILKTIFEVLINKTALLITHRLVGLEQVDQILVINQGKIIEAGTQKELLADPSYYRYMWNLQNRLLKY